MDNQLYKLIKQEGKELNKCNRNLSRYVPEKSNVSLRVVMARGKYPQYYLHDLKQKGEREKLIYLPKAEEGKAQKLAQNKYMEETQKIIERRLKLISNMEKEYSKGSLLDIYNRIPKGRRTLIKPVVQTDEDFIADWRKRNPSGLNNYEEKPEVPTDSGIFVRTKSEELIANKLYAMGIPFIYETRLTLQNGRNVYPDFLVLNVRTRKCFYYEHFGMMNDFDYNLKNLKKIREYEKSGYWFGENFIYTFEYGVETLDSRFLEEIFEKYFK